MQNAKAITTLTFGIFVTSDEKHATLFRQYWFLFANGENGDK